MVEGLGSAFGDPFLFGWAMVLGGGWCLKKGGGEVLRYHRAALLFPRWCVCVALSLGVWFGSYCRCWLRVVLMCFQLMKHDQANPDRLRRTLDGSLHGRRNHIWRFTITSKTPARRNARSTLWVGGGGGSFSTTNEPGEAQLSCERWKRVGPRTDANAVRDV